MFEPISLVKNKVQKHRKACVLVSVLCLLFTVSRTADASRAQNSFNEETENKAFKLSNDKRTYFKQFGAATCFAEGTNRPRTISDGAKCVCKAGYRGKDCGIPVAVFESLRHFPEEIELKRRKIPRRTINAFNFNHEVDLLEARLNDLDDVIDVFAICEANYTARGDSKPLVLAEQMRINPNVVKYNNKIMYIPLNKLPEIGSRNGWFMDRYIRVFLGYRSLPKVKEVKDDDLFILNDADEVPLRSVILFLKLYDGYPVPVKLSMKWSVFGFFWVKKKTGFLDLIFGEEPEMTSMGSVVTVGMLNEVFKGNIFVTRFVNEKISELPEMVDDFKEYTKKVDHPLGWWTVGTARNPAGFHCSWCFQPEGIRVKLLAAHVDDKPRWGDYPEKTELSYLTHLRRSGTWFDGNKPFMRSHEEKEGSKYCPKYMSEHRERFRHLLEL